MRAPIKIVENAFLMLSLCGALATGCNATSASTTTASTATTGTHITSGSGATTGDNTTGTNGTTTETSGNSSAGATTGTVAGSIATIGNGSTTDTNSTTGANTTGTSGTTGGAACDACASNSDCLSNSCYKNFCDPVGLHCSTDSDCGDGTCSSSGYCSCPATSGTSATTGTTTGQTTSSSTTTGATTAGSGGNTGSVGPSGGTVSSLLFAAVGDSRPANEDDTSTYPTQVISKIYQDIQSDGAQFVVSTGDYQFSNPSGSTGAAQLALYAQARASFSGPLFPAMGNHECDGYTADNCTSSGSITSGGSGGTSKNFTAFKQTLLAPINQTLPYYVININGTNGAWTAKFVVIACNAWDSTQSSWLTSALSQSTTYTFIMKHEPAADSAPCTTESENIISAHPYTLKIVGHTHEFRKSESREVIVGNGGAPLASSSDTYGYALITQTSSGQIQVQEIDYNSNAPISSFTVSP